MGRKSQGTPPDFTRCAAEITGRERHRIAENRIRDEIQSRIDTLDHDERARVFDVAVEQMNAPRGCLSHYTRSVWQQIVELTAS